MFTRLYGMRKRGTNTAHISLKQLTRMLETKMLMKFTRIKVTASINSGKADHSLVCEQQKSEEELFRSAIFFWPASEYEKEGASATILFNPPPPKYFNDRVTEFRL